METITKLCLFLLAACSSLGQQPMYINAAKLPAVFYIDNATGNNANNGLSPATAWHDFTYAGTNSIVKTSALAGPVSVLGNAAEVFQETPPIYWLNSGKSATQPITIGPYNGTQMVMSNTPSNLSADGIFAGHANNLYLTGIFWSGNTNWTTNTLAWSAGFLNEPTNSTYYSNIVVTNCQFQGLRAGLLAFSTNDTSGTLNVTVQNCQAWNCAGYGVFCGGEHTKDVYDHTNWVVTGCTFSNIYADHVFVNGEGVSVIQLWGGLVSSNLDHDNGINAITGSAGPTGMIAYHCANVTFDSNEVYNVHRSPSGGDGEGIDADANCVGCIIQHSYCHECDGPGVFLFDVYSNCTCRFNICEHNGLGKNGTSFIYSELSVISSGTACTGIQIYNNTLRATSMGETALCNNANSLQGTNYIFNNIFCVINTNSIVWTGTNVTFQGNDYWRINNGTIGIAWNGTTYSGLPAFVTAGQEYLGFGQSVDPHFVASWNFQVYYGQYGTIPNGGWCNNLTNWVLATNHSTLISNAIDANHFFALTNGGLDFNGKPLGNTNYNIGACNSETIPGLTNIFSGLLAWWPFVESAGTGVNDYSGNGNTVTLVGAPVWSPQWLRFTATSTQHGTIPANAALAVAPLTMTAWLRVTNSAANNLAIIDGTTGSPEWDVLATTPFLWFRTNGASTIFGQSTTALTQGSASWTHAAVTFDGVNFVFYVNGASAGTPTTAIFTQFTSTATYGLGYNRQAVNSYMNGDMRLISWYNRVLSAGEIANIYNLGLASGANGIVGQ